MKRFLAFSLFFLITTILIGQNKFQSEWNIGIGFGPTIPSLSLEPGIKTKSDFRYHGGISIRYISEKNLGLIGEINYSQQGWEQDFKNLENHKDKGYEHTHALDYIEVPLLTHIYFGDKTRFFINLGPKFSFLIGENETISQALIDYVSSIPEESKGDFQTEQFGKKAEKKFDYGIMAGIGMELRSKIGNFALEGRYTFGLGDIYNSSKSDTFARSANRVISVKLTYYTKIF